MNSEKKPVGEEISELAQQARERKGQESTSVDDEKQVFDARVRRLADEWHDECIEACRVGVNTPEKRVNVRRELSRLNVDKHNEVVHAAIHRAVRRLLDEDKFGDVEPMIQRQADFLKEEDLFISIGL